MKSSLRSTLLLVVAILAGTYVTVSGYLESYAAPDTGAASTVSAPSLLLTTFPMPAYLRPAPTPAPVLPVDDVNGSDEDCPTCAKACSGMARPMA